MSKILSFYTFPCWFAMEGRAEGVNTITASRNKSAIGERNLFVDDPLNNFDVITTLLYSTGW